MSEAMQALREGITSSREVKLTKRSPKEDLDEIITMAVCMFEDDTGQLVESIQINASFADGKPFDINVVSA